MDALLRRRAMIAAGGSSPTPPTPPTPTGVVFYDQLIFDGTAYIDTDITPAADSSFRVQLGNETQKVAQRVFQVPADNSTTIGMIYGSNTGTGGRYLSISYGASSAVYTNWRILWTVPTFAFFLTSKNVGYGNTVNHTITKGNNNPSGTLVLGSNAAHSGNPYTGTMWTFRVYGSETADLTTNKGFNDYTPVYTFRPCTYNGEPGMWCEENSTFYGNTAGAGTLSVQNDS